MPTPSNPDWYVPAPLPAHPATLSFGDYRRKHLPDPDAPLRWADGYLARLFRGQLSGPNLRQSADIDDAVQACLAKGLDTFVIRQPDFLKALRVWLFRAADNEARLRWRQKTCGQLADEAEIDLEGREVDPASAVISSEQIDQFEAILRAMPPSEQKSVLLMHLTGWEWPRICSHFGKPVDSSTPHGWLRRTREAVLALWRQRFPGQPLPAALRDDCPSTHEGGV